MPTTTTTYSFNKPVVGADEDDWGGYLNGNWDSVDDLLDGTTPVTGIDINSGTLDGVTIGGTTAGAGTFTTLTANTSITGTLATAAQPNITSVGTLTSLTVSGDVSFGDNDKAIFGAGSDLQIYSDGTTGQITGNVNITGTLTSDGLTVDGTGVEVISVNSTQNGAQINFDSASTSVDWSIGVSNTADGDFLIYQSGSGSGDINLYTGGLKRQEINRNGDISFYEDTGTTPKFFWDASAESLGIGTTSLSTNSIIKEVHINSPYTNGVSRLRLSSSVENMEAAVGLTGYLGDDALYFAIGSSGDGSATERMRIDSSGDLLLGKTTAASTTAGMHLDANGKITTTRSSGPAAAFVRLTSDGDIVSFQKDGTTVGSIGVDNTDNITLSGNSTHSGLMVGTDHIVPYANGSTTDGTEDLGYSAIRWRNLYLSGGVYLGGTGSANKLDDYEEGTWTPVYEAQTGSFTTMTYSNNSGLYTKVGRLVTVQLNLFTSNVNLTGASGFLKVGGLPFTVATDNYAGAVSGMYRWSLASDRTAPIQISAQSGQTYCTMYKNNMNSTTADTIQVTDLTTGASTFRNALIATISYMTT